MKDVVCGMEVSSDSQYHYKYGTKLLLFCSEHCMHKFIETPEQYLMVNQTGVCAEAGSGTTENTKPA